MMQILKTESSYCPSRNKYGWWNKINVMHT